VDPLGGAGIHYWEPIAARYGINITMVNKTIEPDFRFMPVDWDGQIRMDPSSPYAMKNLVTLKDQFDLAVACDTDYDRHGIVTRNAGLLPPQSLPRCHDILSFPAQEPVEPGCKDRKDGGEQPDH
jgi:phosphoglucomutase